MRAWQIREQASNNTSVTLPQRGPSLCGHKAVERLLVVEYKYDSAYVVLTATLSFSLKGGQPGNRPGILTLTLGKQGDKWKVESQAWGRLS